MIMNHKPTEPVAKRDINPVTYTVLMLVCKNLSSEYIMRTIFKHKIVEKSKQKVIYGVIVIHGVCCAQ